VRTKKCSVVFSCLFAVTVALSSLISFSGQACAAWSEDPTVNTPICTASYDQEGPKLISDGSGGAIIAWYDYRGDSYGDIYAQRVDASGVPQWTADGVAICTASNGQGLPELTSDGSGGAIITWPDYRSGTNSDIYAQRIDASGVTQWTADGVAICTVSYDQEGPKLISDGSGGAVITWNDRRSGTNSDIYAQRIDASGVTQWTADGVAICTESSQQGAPKLTSDGSGGAIITWYDRRNGSNYDIYAQRVDASGETKWTADGVAICTESDDQELPTLTSDGSGGAIITWPDYRSGTNSDIYAQRIDKNGNLGKRPRGIPWLLLLLDD
jgi:hypothetical protein